MSLAQRLEILENAHRALSARHEALMMVSRVMLPFIALSQADKERLMLTAYDVLTEHMEKHGHDDEYQQFAREAIDELSGSILVEVKTDA